MCVRRYTKHRLSLESDFAATRGNGFPRCDREPKDLIKDEMSMVPKVFSLAIACLLSLTAEAQLSSSRVSPMNCIGRYHGFGYGDGYHACQDGKCKPSNDSSFWKPWESISSFHAKPTSPPSRWWQTSGVRISPASPLPFTPPQAVPPSPSLYEWVPQFQAMGSRRKGIEID